MLFIYSPKYTILCVICTALIMTAGSAEIWSINHLESSGQNDTMNSNNEITKIVKVQASPDPEPITFHMNYSDSAGFGVGWSGKRVYKDYTHMYPVVTFSKYANTLDDFIEKYPTFTIETSGYAYSNETFGDVGSGKFGSITYLTSDFNRNDFFEKYLVKVDGDTFWWTGAMTTGFGFKYDGNKLYLRPFIDGWLYSGGDEWRYLNYGMSAPSITFHPNEYNN